VTLREVFAAAENLIVAGAKRELSLTAAGRVSSLTTLFFLPQMNKASLVTEVRKILSNGTSNAAAERAIEAVLAGVKRGLRRDKEVSLVGFGTFAMAVRPARNGYNPHTRQPMKIRAIKTIRFKPGAELRSLA
jgi:DNA-binding protein HU-beta